MSFKAMKWAVGKTLPDPYMKLLLLILAHYANDEDFSCWPSVKRLARDCSMSERAVQYKIRALQELGFIRVLIRQHANGDQTSNRYTLRDPDAPPGALDAPPGCKPCTTPGVRGAPKYISTNLSTNLPINEGSERRIRKSENGMTLEEYKNLQKDSKITVSQLMRILEDRGMEKDLFDFMVR